MTDIAHQSSVPEHDPRAMRGLGPVRANEWDLIVPVLEAQAEKHDGRTALRQGATSLTYGQLHAAVNRLARYLRRRGIGRGDRVALVLPRSIDAVIGILAIVKAGAAYLPIDLSYPPARIRYVLADADVAAALTTTEHEALLPVDVARVLMDEAAEAIAREDAAPLSVQAQSSDPFYLIYTSGSTGQPKGAAVSHQSVGNLLRWYVSRLGLTPNDGALLISALGFDLTQKNIFAPLLVGGMLHLPVELSYDPEAIVAEIENGKVTFVTSAPSAFLPLIDGLGKDEPRRLRSLRWVVLGGEPVSAARLLPWLRSESCRARILNYYGPTECTDLCATFEFDAATAREPIPFGRPIDNVVLAVLDDLRRPVPDGAEGELWIGGACVGLGYHDRPALTAERFAAIEFAGQFRRMYRSGDRVRWRPDDQLEFVGRVDHQVKLRGHRIELGEVEATLATHPAVREAVAVIRQDEAGSDILIAFVVQKVSGAASDATLRTFMADRLPEPMVPSCIVELQAMPLSPNGKLDRRALPTAPQPRSAAGSTMTDIVMEIWTAVLGRAPDSPDRSFFDLGGTSLGAAQVQAALRRRLGQAVPIVKLFAHPTAASLARFLEHGEDEAARGLASNRAAGQAHALRRLNTALARTM